MSLSLTCIASSYPGVEFLQYWDKIGWFPIPPTRLFIIFHFSCVLGVSRLFFVFVPDINCCCPLASAQMAERIAAARMNNRFAVYSTGRQPQNTKHRTQNVEPARTGLDTEHKHCSLVRAHRTHSTTHQLFAGS